MGRERCVWGRDEDVFKEGGRCVCGKREICFGEEGDVFGREGGGSVFTEKKCVYREEVCLHKGGVFTQGRYTEADRCMVEGARYLCMYIRTYVCFVEKSVC